MGLLDELKKQASATQQQQQSEEQRKAKIAAEIEAAMSKTFSYLTELAKQLNVIKPATDRTFTLDGQTSFTQLRMDDFHASARRVGLKHEDPWAYVMLRFEYVNDTPLVLKKEMEQIDRFRALLTDNGVSFECDEVMRSRDKAAPAVFKIPQEVRATVQVTPDFATGEIVFELRNIDRFGAYALVTEAEKVDEALLEELAKYLIGQPSDLRTRCRYRTVQRTG